MERLDGDDGQFKFNYPRAFYIESIVLSIVYFFAFFFFLFITVVVIRKEDKHNKVLVAMLIFLQLAALFQAMFYVLDANYYGEYFTERQYNIRLST